MNTFRNPVYPKGPQANNAAAPFFRMAPAPIAFLAPEKLEPQVAKYIQPVHGQQKKELTITVKEPAPPNPQANGFPQAEVMITALFAFSLYFAYSAVKAIQIRLAGKAESK